MDSGLLYAEGYARRPSGITTYSAWCLEGETVVDPGFREPGTAYFGVALRPGFVRRFHDARRSDDGSDMFSYVFIGPYEEMRPPLDPAADIVAGLGRDIPSRVRDWALTTDRPPGEDRVAPDWVLDELLRLPEREHLSIQPRRPRPRSARRPGTNGARLGPMDAVQFGPREDDSPIRFTIDTGRGRMFAPRPAPPTRQANDTAPAPATSAGTTGSER